MSDTVIKVENLGKKYIIGHELQRRGQYATLRDVIADKTKRLFSFGRNGKGGPTHEEIWALKDVSFEVKQGDRLGIIGRNGAGKSTLLKILSRITEPTTGRISIIGRVGSLLEVGTGFHPELTGTENIYLNGAILGMSKGDIRKRFDEIVAFAEIDKFLDTPVKRYSSGMYVRLAFAVAAHLEPEILIVDEVLSVGDAQFQKKCLGKMEEVSGEGRTVLFVSHLLAAVEQMCNRCFLINSGRLEKSSDDVRDVIKAYTLSNTDGVKQSEWVNVEGRYENNWFVPSRVILTDQMGTPLTMPVRNDSDVCIQVEGSVLEENEKLTVSYSIYDEENLLLYQSATHDEPSDGLIRFRKGTRIIRTKIPKRFLNEGEYRVELQVFLHGEKLIVHSGNRPPTVYLRIEGGLSDSERFLLRRNGILAPVLHWDIN